MNKRILVELDALLDTRLGAMNIFSPSVSALMVEDTKYYSRIIDDFDRYGPGTTMMWRSVYGDRDVEVLARSFPTCIPAMVGEFVRELYAKAMDNPVWHGADVVINTFPYDLPESDCEEIVDAVREMIVPMDGDKYAYDPVIKTTRISHHDLSIDAIRENWEMVVMYNFHEWFEANATSLLAATRGASLSSMFVPALFKEMIDRKSLINSDGSHLNPFDESRRYLAPYFQLHFWDSQLFSMPNPFD